MAAINIKERGRSSLACGESERNAQAQVNLGRSKKPAPNQQQESTEVIIAGSKRDKEETVYEISDLAYHVMVLMIELGISVEDITKELEKRPSSNPFPTLQDYTSRHDPLHIH